MLVIGSLIGLFAFAIPLLLGMVRCIKYLFKIQVATTHTNHPSFEGILDVDETPKTQAISIKKWEYAESVSLGVAPIVGIVAAYFFIDMEVPFDPKFALSAQVFILIGFFSYWTSRHFKKEAPLLVQLLLPYGIVIGIICYLMLFVHFLSVATLLALAFLSIVTFPLLAPLPATLYAIRQLKIHCDFINEKLDESKQVIPFWVQSLRWRNKLSNLLYLVLFIVIIQLVLLTLGQPLNGFWLAFRESKEFFFSATKEIAF